MRSSLRAFLLSFCLLVVVGCSGGGGASLEAGIDPGEGLVAFTAGWVLDGTGAPPIEGGIVLVRDGVIEVVGPFAAVTIPEGVEMVDLGDAWILPGLVNAHGHVSGDRAEALDQLEQYAYYGITTVVSLGNEEPAAFDLRDEQSTPDLNRARIYVAGPVIAPSSVEEAVAEVDRVAGLGADWVKFRVDDNLGLTSKMPSEVYSTVIETAHDRGLPVAIHIVELEDAIGVVQAGGDLVAHSVRDAPVDQTLIDAMTEGGVCLVPTLMREVSTYVYADGPDFLEDPFFLERAAPEDLDAVLTPRFLAGQTSEAAEYYRVALPLAQANATALYEAGVGIAMGTDSGPTGRFQGYFEHLELELMAEGGMPNDAVIHAATGAAAECMGLEGEVGTLGPGARADLLVLNANPLEDVTNSRDIHSVWIAGNRIR